MRPKSLADHKVHQAISIEVGHVKRVGLGKLDTIPILLRCLVHKAMHLERNVTRLCFHMLQPGDSIPVTFDRGHNVIVTIPIHVEDEHLRTIKSKRPIVVFPKRVPFNRFRLFPPAF